MSVVPSIDLAASWDPPMAQGDRPTCLALTASELNRNLCGHSAPLSAEYIYRAAARRSAVWKAGAGLLMSHLAEALSQNGQPMEKVCPYLADEPQETPPAIPILPAAETLYTATVQLISTAPQVIEEELRKGNPVGLVLKLTDTFLKPVKGMIDFSYMLLGTDMHHAVVATGLGSHSGTGAPHFRIRNTWGGAWGEKGTAWLPHSYVQLHAVSAFKV